MAASTRCAACLSASRQGEIVALIGPNGAGKSTCFNMLNGQIRPDAGTIRLDGRDITGWPPREVWRLGVGRTFQITATFASMSVIENVQMVLLSHAGRLRPLWGLATRAERERAQALLALVGMLGAGRAALGRARLWRPQAARTRHGARQRAAASLDG